MFKNRAVVLAALIALVLLVTQATIRAQNYTGYTRVYVYEDGEVHVQQVIELQESIPITVKVVGTPYLLIVVNEMGEPLLYNLTEGTLQILPEKPGEINITYFSKLHSSNAIYNMSLESLGRTEVYLDQSYILVNVTVFPDEISTPDNWTLLVFRDTYEDIRLSFFEVGEAGVKSGINKKSSKEKPKQDFVLILIISTLALIITVAVGLFLYKRRSGLKELGEDDKKIINYIKKRGGEAYLKDIRRDLNLPSTTAWRRVKRLEQMGFLKTKRTAQGLKIWLT